ncbi:histidinol-phosphate transaminase [Dyadobacter sp. CY347]|uniref:pyridoxal phosphate-dependent aminotransferase n=1 Tax=Dyadobacter sp. CY347 TaxID=2909336 RepID=UPI001F3B8CB3|nr:threonine-phosphate decarboxylase [Dyadobacter sp. CY347]MCF2487550.1 pyridoxal phosphate-dependent class II aminotransferase [Dyadobacter sp. CY347]
MLTGHGDDAYRYEREIIADFSTNVWHGGTPAGLKAYLWENMDRIERYPQVLAENLTQKIVKHHNLAAEQVLVCNGTTESIYLIAQLFSGSKTTILTPSFAEYEDACQIFNHELSYLPWLQALEMPQLRSDVVFICNPNNPTGRYFADLQFWIKRSPGCIFVIDEAFIDFTEGLESAIDLVKKYRNVVILRSLTKTYSIPGLRLGYLLANDEIISQLTAIKQPWTVNVMAQAAGEFIFEHYDQVQLPMATIWKAKAEFVNQLRQNEAIVVEESETHFFLCKTLVRNAAQLKDFLIQNHGILIRDAGNFRSLTRQHFRLATLTPEKNQLLIEALKAWTKLHY